MSTADRLKLKRNKKGDRTVNKTARKRAIMMVFGAVLMAILIAAFCVLSYFNLIHQKSYTAEEFGIETVKSGIDYNNNGIDDYTDIPLGARADAQNHPTYNGNYYDGGYPPDDIGVCTDVVWRAFKNAGYSLRDMVNRDIINRREAYPQIKVRDNNIDFRRVSNLQTFFEQYAVKLTTDTDKIAEWQAGDIVVFNGGKHIGIVSDKRNSKGQPYIIHNGGQPNREEDYFKRAEVYAHYRFDASQIDDEVLIAF